MLSILKQDLLDLLDYARECHPNEVFVLLRGDRKGEKLKVKEFLTPPFSVGGRGFASFRPHLLPIDFSVIGTAHSHPAGPPRPSMTDLTNFYSRVMLIVAAPYRIQDVAAYNKRGEQVHVEAVDKFE